MSQENPKNPLYYRQGNGLQTASNSLKILPGERLFIVENRKKGQRILSLFPEDEGISTEGVPFDIDINNPKTGDEPLSYKILLNQDKGERLATEIRKKLEKVKIVFILTDNSSKGEAIAQGLMDNIPQLQGKTNRVRAKSLERKYLKNLIEQEGKLPPDRWSRPDRLKAESHWTRSVMDITWKRKVSVWVGEAAQIVRSLHNIQVSPKAQESLSRLQCSILHILNNKESARKNYRGYKYWTVQVRLMGNIFGSSLGVAIAVPNFSMLEDKTNPFMKKIWQEKLEECIRRNREGTGIPQHEPGTPWRFDTEEEAIQYRHHIKRYSLFTLETLETWDEQEPPTPAHNTSSILEKAYKQEWGKQREVAEVLKDLYLAGLITQSKTGSGNISPESFERLWKFAVAADIKLCRERRLFHKDIPGQEAIQPTEWDKTPPQAQGEISRSTKPPRVALAERIYREIYEQAIKSQFTDNPQRILQVSVIGPLPSTAADAFKGKFTQKESPFESLMGVVLTGRISNLERENPLFKLRKNSLMQAVKVWVEEHETQAPEGINREELLLQMQKENLGKLETLTALIPKMEDAGLLQEKDGYIILTETGKITIQFLNAHLGNFIHLKYHEIVENQLKEIEHGRTNPLGFLQYWWKTLNKVDLPPIPEALADSSGKSLQEIEERMRSNMPQIPEEISMEQAG